MPAPEGGQVDREEAAMAREAEVCMLAKDEGLQILGLFMASFEGTYTVSNICCRV